MANKPGILRANLPWLRRIGVAVLVLAILGCAGLVGGTYVAFFFGIYAPDEPVDRPIALRGGLVFDGVSKAPTPGMVLIEGEQITCVGECEVPPEAQVLEMTNLFLMPGIIDLHVHLGAFADDDAQRTPRAAMWDVLRHRPAQRRAFLEAGVTAVRSVGDDPYGTSNQRIWLADGTIAGPRLFLAGPAFTAPGGHPANRLEESPWISDAGVIQIDDADRARTRVHELADLGMDGVKAIYDDVDDRVPKLDRAVLDAVGQEAETRELWFAVHVGTNMDVQHALAAGATTIEHIARDELLPITVDAMVDSGVVVVPTLAVTRSLAPDEAYQRIADNVLRAYQAGVPIGVGSDTQGPKMAFGASTIDEIQLLIEAGLEPLDALRAATSTGAKVLGKEGEIGVLAEGAAADLVAFHGDPRTDPTALDRPVLVIENGRVAFDRR